MLKSRAWTESSGETFSTIKMAAWMYKLWPRLPSTRNIEEVDSNVAAHGATGSLVAAEQMMGCV